MKNKPKLSGWTLFHSNSSRSLFILTSSNENKQKWLLKRVWIWLNWCVHKRLLPLSCHLSMLMLWREASDILCLAFVILPRGRPPLRACWWASACVHHGCCRLQSLVFCCINSLLNYLLKSSKQNCFSHCGEGCVCVSVLYVCVWGGCNGKFSWCICCLPPPPHLHPPTSSPPPSLTFPFVSLSIHTSESQQEFFRMLDEKIEKVRRPEVGFVGEGCSEGGAGHLK